MSDYPLGNLQIRPSEGRTFVAGHKHGFDHSTFPRRGIVLVQQLDDAFNVLKQTQIASREYLETLRLLRLYEPGSLRLPYRIPTNNPESPWGMVGLFIAGTDLPAGAEPIPLRPLGDYVLIKAGVRHSLFALTPGAEWDCIYTHRTPQGDVSQAPTGWEEAYR